MGSTSFKNKVVGIFSDKYAVHNVITELNNNGFDSDSISVLARDMKDEERIRTHSGSSTTYPTDTLRDTELKHRYPDIVNEDEDFEDLHDVKEKDPEAMVKGAAAGGAIGLLGGLAVLMLPGVGPVLAAGPIYTAITAATGGAALGATAGTIIGLLKDEGIPNDRADFYSRNFNKGNVLVMIHTDEGRSSLAREILVRHNPDVVDTF